LQRVYPIVQQQNDARAALKSWDKIDLTNFIMCGGLQKGGDQLHDVGTKFLQNVKPLFSNQPQRTTFKINQIYYSNALKYVRYNGNDNKYHKLSTL
jgi:hypothetical protein